MIKVIISDGDGTVLEMFKVVPAVETGPTPAATDINTARELRELIEHTWNTEEL